MEKKIRTNLLRIFIVLFLCPILCCNKCKDVVCNNGGTCNGNGDCVCDCGYTGLHCETPPPQCGSINTNQQIAPIIQQEIDWCWLTCGEMIFRHYNIPQVNPISYQCGIIGSINSNCYNNCADCAGITGTMSDVQSMLLNYPRKSCNQNCVGIKSTLVNSPLTMDVITKDLLNGYPILAGIAMDGSPTPSHAVLIVAYTYDNIGNLLLYINDPWPYDAFGQISPYLNNDGHLVVEGQYLIPYAYFMQGNGLRWEQTLYGISL